MQISKVWTKRLSFGVDEEKKGFLNKGDQD
jgi:hypothetical protein